MSQSMTIEGTVAVEERLRNSKAIRRRTFSGRMMSNKKGDVLMEEIVESVVSDIEQD